MNKNWLNAVLPHVYAILIFIALAFVFCSPVLNGEELKQTDTISWKGAAEEAIQYVEKTGRPALWTNSLFGGMPTYQISLRTDNYSFYIHQIFTLGLPRPVNFLFMAMLGFYFLLAVVGFRHWINVTGAIAFGFCSFNPIVISAGHETQMVCISYMAPVIAGILLTYRGRLLTGGIVTSVMLCMMIANNHYQILYYTLIICFIIGVAYLVNAIKNGTTGQYIKSTLVLLAFGILAVLPSMASFWTTYEYAPYTMRGGHSELTLDTAKHATNKTRGGLDKDYAFTWSLGVGETFTLLVPNMYGGTSHENIGTGSKTYEALTQIGVPPAQAEGFVSAFPLYWGPQPFTEPVYFGAAVIFLFVLSLFIIKSWQKWWMLTVCVLGVIMAWGDHFAAFNYFLFDHLPMYNKFRAPSMALVMPQVLVPFMACWGLNDLVEGKLPKPELLKRLRQALYVTGGLCLLLIIASLLGVLSFEAKNDTAKSYYEQMASGNPGVLQQLTSALTADRAAALRSDAFRSLFIVLVAAALIWLLLKDKIRLPAFFLLTGLVVLVDLFQVDKRYLNKENFVTPQDFSGIFLPSPVDQAILKDPDPYYRVLNASVPNFASDALTSYHHKSVGGYHAAKLAIYQDLIEYQIAKNNVQVLNMLNTKYIIFNNPQGQQAYQQNPDALGNAWFVSSLKWVPNANEEMKALDHFNPKDTAVIDERFAAGLKDYRFGRDSASSIKLTQYDLNALKYQSTNSQDGFAVFSDIYYPKGWNIYIDGKPGEIVRVNYVLRGAKIPAGKHEIEMRFEPRSYYTGNMISKYSSILMWLLVIGAVAMEVRRRWRPQPQATDNGSRPTVLD